MNQQVAIALEIGNTIFKQKNYHGMISGLMKEPRFLLFYGTQEASLSNQLNQQKA